MTWIVILGFGGYLFWCSKGHPFGKGTEVLRNFTDALGLVLIVVGIVGLLSNAGARVDFPWVLAVIAAALLFLLQFASLWGPLHWLGRPYGGFLLNRILLGITAVGILETIVSQI